MKILKRLLQSIALLIGLLLVVIVGLFIITAGDHNVPDTVATDPTIPHVDNRMKRTNHNRKVYSMCA